uniref:Transposase n=1 Tax=Panagrolaimus davidi TaxID=227884 RepID=A0A914R1E3_9BILA
MKCLGTIQAHNGPVNGISVDGSVGEIFTTIGQDSQLKHWPDFVIAGESIFVWKLYHDSAVRTYDFGPNTVHSIRWQLMNQKKTMENTAKERKIIRDKKKRKKGNLRRCAKPGTL